MVRQKKRELIMSKKIENEEVDIIWSDRKRHLGLPISFTKYSLSEDRLFIKTGFLNLREDEVRLYRILDVRLIRPLGQRLFGVGTIEIHSSDKSLRDFQILKVKQPQAVKEKLSQLVEAERDRKRVSRREFIGDPDEADDDMDDDNLLG